MSNLNIIIFLATIPLETIPDYIEEQFLQIKQREKLKDEKYQNDEVDNAESESDEDYTSGGKLFCTF